MSEPTFAPPPKVPPPFQERSQAPEVLRPELARFQESLPPDSLPKVKDLPSRVEQLPRMRERSPAPIVVPAEPAGDVAKVPGEDPTLGLTGRPLPDLPAPGPRLRPLGESTPAVVMALCNQKGGVGKTTTVINLGAALAEYGRKMLLVDFDPQASLTVGLGFNPNTVDPTIYHLMMERGVMPADVAIETHLPGVDLIPSNIDFAGAEMQLINEVGREQVLARALEPATTDYDVILIDCQPSLGLLAVNALAASDGVIIPLECEYFALRGVALLKGTIDKVQQRINSKLSIVGLLGTMYDGRTLHSREVLQTLVSGWGEAVFHTVIRRTVKFSEATVAGEPMTEYASGSNGAEAYRQLANEVLVRCPEA